MKIYLSFIILALYGNIISAQTLHFRPGISYATLDWTYLDPRGTRTEQYKAPLLGYAVGLGLEYFDKGLFSLSSDLWVYRSGGQLTDTEKEQRPQPGRIGFGDPEQLLVDYAAFSTCANFNPINSKMKLQVQLGPRIDFLLGGADKQPLKFVNDRDGLSQVNYGFNLGVGLYRVTKKLEYGIQTTWLSRLKKLADLESEITPGAIYAGAKANEQIFLLQLSLGYHLK